jgi:hypothetical protein
MNVVVLSLLTYQKDGVSPEILLEEVNLVTCISSDKNKQSLEQMRLSSYVLMYFKNNSGGVQ